MADQHVMNRPVVVERTRMVLVCSCGWWTFDVLKDGWFQNETELPGRWVTHAARELDAKSY